MEMHIQIHHTGGTTQHYEHRTMQHPNIAGSCGHERRRLHGIYNAKKISIRLGEKKLDQETYEGWFNSLRPIIKDTTLNQYICLCIQFSKYLQTLGVEAFVPERVIARSDYIPYLFSEDQIIALIQAADGWFNTARYKPVKTSAAQFSIVIRILYGCGMRVNEVLSLKARDVDFESAVIYVRNGKGKNMSTENSSDIIYKLEQFNKGIFPEVPE